MKNIETAKRFIEDFFRPGSTWDEVGQYVEGDGAYTHPIIPQVTLKDAYATLPPKGSFNAFPDLMQRVVSAAVAENGHIYVQTIASGTFLNDFGDAKPNGRKWSIPIMWDFTFNEAGKIVHGNEICNHHSINQQLGTVVFKAPFEYELDLKKKSESVTTSLSLFSFFKPVTERPLLGATAATAVIAAGCAFYRTFGKS